MCGICGVVYPDSLSAVAPVHLQKMNATLRRRGPDGEGFFYAPGVGFGHRRLGVIDLQTGAQPMSDREKRVTLVFNGEIYNFRSIRGELERLGTIFRTQSDTEVLIEGYKQWGLDLLPRLVGMFAFALWDHRSQSLFLCRDRLGVKPLYWTRTEKGALVFGSTLDSVIAHPDTSRKLDNAQFANYLSLGYVPGQQSVLSAIERLPPAHVLIWRRGTEPVLKRWWDLADIWRNSTPDTRPTHDIQADFNELLRTAVQDRLVSDVPLGAFLSGGLDSTAVTAYMRKSIRELKTFSIGFEDPSFNELPFARQAAEALETQHYEEKLQGSDPDLLTEIASACDEPFADTSIIPTFLLSKMAKRQVTVVLSGDGGDELLGGYITHSATRLQKRVQSLPHPLRRLAIQSAGWIPQSRKKLHWTFKARQFLKGAELDSCSAHASWRMLADTQGLSALLSREVFEGADPFSSFRQAYEQVPTLDFLDRFLFVDYQTWLVDDILTKVDRASMAHGLEVRSPFLDHRLVEFCAKVPTPLKRKGGNGKILLKETAKKEIPNGILNRSKKGFNAPVSQWLVQSWKDLLMDGVQGQKEIFRIEAIEKLWKEHETRRRDHGHLLFAVLMGVQWLRRVQPTL